MADYDIDLQYQPSRINMAPNGLSQKPMQKELLEEMRYLDLEVVLFVDQEDKGNKEGWPQVIEIQVSGRGQTEDRLYIYKYMYRWIAFLW